MKHETAVSLFEQMHPEFFEKPWIRSMAEDQVYEELIMDLNAPVTPAPEPVGDVTFGWWDGTDLDGLKAIVGEVSSNWPQYYLPDSPVYCAFCDGKIVSFCLVHDMGVFEVEGRKVRIGGPGCVGTLPAYRRRGIGLKMVEKATQILKERGFDYSYIHYTGVGPWYAKLGYELILQWDKHGLK